MVFESSRAAGDPDTTPKPKPEAYRRHLEPSNTYVYALQPGKKKKKNVFRLSSDTNKQERDLFLRPPKRASAQGGP